MAADSPASGRGDGTGEEVMSERTRALRPKKVARSICPYCAVGCGQLVFHRDGKLLSIEGDQALFHFPGGSFQVAPDRQRSLIPQPVEDVLKVPLTFVSGLLDGARK
jgi:hypothetical protein